jgi:hypothetical protein
VRSGAWLSESDIVSETLMAEDLQHQYIQCLAAADDLETYWNYYQQCREHEFGKECHEAAVAFFKFFDNLPTPLRVQMDFETDKIFAQSPQFSKITEILRVWVEHSKGMKSGESFLAWSMSFSKQA